MEAETGSTGARRYSIAQLLFVVPWIALVIDAWAPIGDNSFLWHIRAGELQIEAGSVLVADPFSFTKLGAEWLTQSWLADVLYAWLESFTGLDFVPWMLLVTSSLTFIGIGLIAYRANPNPAATSIVLILATVSFISFLVPRPVLFSYLLFVLVILAWERPRIRWLIPFLFWLWASVHGSFFLGLAYIGLRLIARKEWKALPAAMAGAVAVLFTAHGLGVVQMLLDFFAARPYLSLLTEWRPPELLSPVFLPVFVALALILVGAALGRVPVSTLWVVIPFLALALTATRSVPPALLALVAVTAISIGLIGSRLPKRFGAGPTAVFALLVLGLPFVLIGDAGLADDRFPVEAAKSLDGSKTFHDDVVGGYLIWSEGPERLVYIDDRAELYQEQMESFVEIRAGREDWRPTFEEFDIQQAILRQGEPIVDWLGDAGWVEVYSDDEFIVLRAN
jgi:hypothetical protein